MIIQNIHKDNILAPSIYRKADKRYPARNYSPHLNRSVGMGFLNHLSMGTARMKEQQEP